MRRGVVTAEDYAESCCLLSGEKFKTAAPLHPIPRQRIAGRLDRYMARRDYAGAERHLLYWMREAELSGDRWGMLFLCGELVGFYRKTGNREKALLRGEQALALLDELRYAGTATAGTTLINVATAYSAFGENERALTLFAQARDTLESLPEVSPRLLASLYNNMSAALQAAGRLAEASALYEKALAVLAELPGTLLEQAVTLLNLADSTEAGLGPEAAEGRVAELLERAWTLLNDTGIPRDGDYAFVCEKCAPGFLAHGWFAAAEELRNAAQAVRESGEA